jgi:hypothetical protein
MFPNMRDCRAMIIYKKSPSDISGGDFSLFFGRVISEQSVRFVKEYDIIK